MEDITKIGGASFMIDGPVSGAPSVPNVASTDKADGLILDLTTLGRTQQIQKALEVQQRADGLILDLTTLGKTEQAKAVQAAADGVILELVLRGAKGLLP